jgi:hypothetical protein
LWISGSPGAGKSAVASTLVSNFTKQRRLGSFFFFKRGDASLGDPTALWRTVAFDLAKFHPNVKDGLLEFLSRPGFRHTDVLLHFECMIEEILVKNETQLSTAPPIVVIDALDECGSDDSQSGQRQILLETICRWSRLPRLFRLVVTSRDERLPSSLADPNVCHKIVLETGDSVNPETHKDIRTFFQQSLDQIRPNFGLASTWPGDSVIEKLTQRAAGLFIWAKTAMAFMEEKRFNPATKLDLILTGQLGKRNDNIDALYRQILDFSFRDSDESMLQLFRAVVGVIIFAKAPVRRDDLKYLLGRENDDDEWQFSVILRNLSSILEVDETLRLRHLSFAEFLTDTERCCDHRFVVDPKEQHRNLTMACLQIMKTELRFNICKLETSHVRNDDVINLSERIRTMVSTQLQYSCRFWSSHLCDTINDEAHCDSLLKEARDFFYTRLLYWLEVMSVIKDVPSASIALLTIAHSQRIKVCNVMF